MILDDFATKNDSTLKDWATFVHPPHDIYYVQKWVDWEESKSWSFNIGAFFFGAFWMIYRKMYVQAGLFFIFILMEGFLEATIVELLEIYDIEYLINIGSTMIIATVMGFLGNWIYLTHTKKEIEKVSVANPDPTSFKAALKAKGGTSSTAVIIAIVLYFTFFGLLFYMNI